MIRILILLSLAILWTYIIFSLNETFINDLNYLKYGNELEALFFAMIISPIYLIGYVPLVLFFLNRVYNPLKKDFGSLNK